MHHPTSFPRRSLLRAGAAGLALASLGARAQSGWPTKPVTLIVPFPAGGGTDAFARPLSAQFAKQTGKQLIVDNRGGAGGTLGATIAARAQPDGYTLFMGAIHHAIAPRNLERSLGIHACKGIQCVVHHLHRWECAHAPGAKCGE